MASIRLDAATWPPRSLTPTMAGAGAGLALVTALCAQVALSGLRHLTQPDGALGPATALTTLAATAGTLLGAWLTLCAACTWVALLCRDSRSWARPSAWVALASSPAWLRPALGALLAGSLSLGVTAPALARDRPGATHSPGPGPSRSTLPAPVNVTLPAPGWLPAPLPAPTRGCAQRATALVTSADRRMTPDDEIVVRRGDTLWHLAARSLGPSATAADIASEWPRWWHANRQQIGADPGLLLPGMRLLPPAATGAMAAAGSLPEKVR